VAWTISMQNWRPEDSKGKAWTRTLTAANAYPWQLHSRVLCVHVSY
jgi:hypothetical protein